MLRHPVIVPAVNPTTGRPNAEHGYAPRPVAVVVSPPVAAHVIGVPVVAPAAAPSCVATVQPLSAPPPAAAAQPTAASAARRKEE
jgi:hypothetical protein